MSNYHRLKIMLSNDMLSYISFHTLSYTNYDFKKPTKICLTDIFSS